MSPKKKRHAGDSDEGSSKANKKKKLTDTKPEKKTELKKNPPKPKVVSEENKVYRKDPQGNIYVLTPDKQKQIVYPATAGPSSNASAKGGVTQESVNPPNKGVPAKKPTKRFFLEKKHGKKKVKESSSSDSSSSDDSSDSSSSSEQSVSGDSEYADEEPGGDSGDDIEDVGSKSQEGQKGTKTRADKGNKDKGKESADTQHAGGDNEHDNDDINKTKKGEDRIRNQRWSADENSTLVHQAADKWSLVKGKFKHGSGGRQDRDKAWAQIVAEVNVAGGFNRTVRQCQKKLGYLQSEAREKNRKLKEKVQQSGHGTIPARELLTDVEITLLDCMGEEAIRGVPNIKRAPVRPGEEDDLLTPDPKQMSKHCWQPKAIRDAQQAESAKRSDSGTRKALSYSSNEPESSSKDKHHKKKKKKTKKKKKKKKKKTYEESDGSSAEVSSTLSDPMPLMSDYETEAPQSSTPLNPAGDQYSPLHIKTIITPQKEKVTLVFDQKLNVVGRYDGSPLPTLTAPTKKHVSGIKNPDFRRSIDQEIMDEGDAGDDGFLEDLEEKPIPSKSTLHQTVRQNIEKVVQADVSEIAETTGVQRVSDVTHLSSTAALGGHDKESSTLENSAKDYKYDDGSNSVVDLTMEDKPPQIEEQRVETSSQSGENCELTADGTRDINVSRNTDVTIQGNIGQPITIAEHVSCTHFSKVLGRQTDILEGLEYFLKKVITEDSERKKQKPEFYEPHPKLLEIIQNQNTLIEEQSKTLRRQEELIGYHKQCLDRLGGIVKTLTSVEDMTSDMSCAVAREFVALAKERNREKELWIQMSKVTEPPTTAVQNPKDHTDNQQTLVRDDDGRKNLELPSTSTPLQNFTLPCQTVLPGDLEELGGGLYFNKREADGNIVHHYSTTGIESLQNEQKTAYDNTLDLLKQASNEGFCVEPSTEAGEDNGNNFSTKIDDNNEGSVNSSRNVCPSPAQKAFDEETVVDSSANLGDTEMTDQVKDFSNENQEKVECGTHAVEDVGKSKTEEHDNNESTNDNVQSEPANENVLAIEKQNELGADTTLPITSSEPCTSTNLVLTIEEQSALLLAAVGQVDFTNPEAVSAFIHEHAEIARVTTEAFRTKNLAGESTDGACSVEKQSDTSPKTTVSDINHGNKNVSEQMAVAETSKATKKKDEDSEATANPSGKPVEAGESSDDGKSKGKRRKKKAKSNEPTVSYETRSKKK